MKNITTLSFQQLALDLTKMDKFRKKVLKQYPRAVAIEDCDGIRIMSGENFIAEEYLFPNTYNEDVAWEYAATACRVTQNFNRTHPLRMDLSSIEHKLYRVNKRLRNARNAKQTKKNAK